MKPFPSDFCSCAPIINYENSAETYPAVHNSQLGPGRAADWVDGVVGKVYMYIIGCVSARRVYSARVCVRICLPYGKWWA